MLVAYPCLYARENCRQHEKKKTATDTVINKLQGQ